MLLQVQQIASRVKELREILEYQPSEVARQIDVTEDVYRQYENAEIDIPVGKLYLIANVLHVDPTVLLIGDAPRMVDYTVVRQGNGIGVDRYAGYRFTSLAYNYINREMEPMIVTLDPDKSRPELVTHAGQEFNFVLEGTIAVTIDDKEVVLKAGDSIYFNPQIPHGQRALGEHTARFLTIINE